MGDESRPQRTKGIRCVGTVTHANAGATGIDGHLQVVRRVANHQHARRIHTQLGHELVQHARVRLAGSFIGGARGVEQALQFHCRETGVQPAAALAGGHGQRMLALAKIGQHGEHPLEQADAVLLRLVMDAVARAQLGVTFPGHIRRRMRQGLQQPQTDHVRGRGIAGHGSADIAHRRLDAAGNDGR